jgi:ABC-2 type transport system permease protein
VNIDKNIVTSLEDSSISVEKFESASYETVKNQGLDGLLHNDGGKIELILLNDDPTTSKALQMKVNQAIASQFQPKIGSMGSGSMPSIETKYVYGSSETTFFDILISILIGFFVFFFVFLISGIGLLRERTTGTLERLMSTPIKRPEVIAGYLVGYGIFAVIQTLIVVIYAINVLDITLAGSFWNVIIISLMLALTALSLGILLSTFASSEFQMIQFIPIVIIPQVFFSGIIPIEGMANWLQVLAKFMPLYYGADALKSVMYKGLDIGGIYKDLLFLAIFITVFIILNIVVLRKYRKQ